MSLSRAAVYDEAYAAHLVSIDLGGQQQHSESVGVLQCAYDQLLQSRPLWIEQDYILALQILHDISVYACDDLRDRELEAKAINILLALYQHRPDINDLQYQSIALVTLRTKLHRTIKACGDFDSKNESEITEALNQAAEYIRQVRLMLAKLPVEDVAQWNQLKDTDYIHRIISITYYDLAQYEVIFGNKKAALLAFSKAVEEARHIADDGGESFRILYGEMREAAQYDVVERSLFDFGKCVTNGIYAEHLNFRTLSMLRDLLITNLNHENIYKLELFEQLLTVMQDVIDSGDIYDENHKYIPFCREMQDERMRGMFLAMRAHVAAVRQSFYQAHEGEVENITHISRLVKLNARVMGLKKTIPESNKNEDELMSKHEKAALEKKLTQLNVMAEKLSDAIKFETKKQTSRRVAVQTLDQILVTINKGIDQLPPVEHVVWNGVSKSAFTDLQGLMHHMVSYYQSVGDTDHALRAMMRAVRYASLEGAGEEYYHRLKAIYKSVADAYDPAGESEPVIVMMYQVIIKMILSKSSDISDILRELGLLRSVLKENLRIENMAKFELIQQFLQIIHDKLANGLLDKHSNNHYKQAFPGVAFRKAMEIPIIRNHFESVYEDVCKMTAGLRELTNHVPFKIAMLQGLNNLEKRVEVLELAKREQPLADEEGCKPVSKKIKASKVKATMFAKRERKEELADTRVTRKVKR